MKAALASRGAKTVLSLEGAVTINEMDTLKEVLLSAKKEAAYLEVQLDQVTRIDLSGLQMLCAALRSFRIEKKVLTLKAGAKNSFWKIVEESGYHTVIGAALYLKTDN